MDAVVRQSLCSRCRRCVERAPQFSTDKNAIFSHRNGRADAVSPDSFVATLAPVARRYRKRLANLQPLALFFYSYYCAVRLLLILISHTYLAASIRSAGVVHTARERGTRSLVGCLALQREIATKSRRVIRVHHRASHLRWEFRSLVLRRCCTKNPGYVCSTSRASPAPEASKPLGTLTNSAVSPRNFSTPPL